MPNVTSTGTWPSTTRSTPTAATAMLPQSTGSRPKVSSSTVPVTRPVVIAATNRANAAAPSHAGAPYPSTIATPSQSLATPSVSAMARTMTPIMRVRGSVQALSAWLGRASASACGSTARNPRTEAAPSSATSTATAPTCHPIPTPTNVTKAPTAAPATVPRLKAAWKRGMIERPSSRSTSAPSTFIATSQVPVPRPTRNRPTAVTGTVSRTPTPTATSSSPAASNSVAPITTRRAPKRCTVPPDVGSAMTDPIDTASSSSPSCAGPRSSACRTDGMREAQVANAKPLRKNVAITALRAVSSSRVAVPVERLTLRTLSRPGPRPGTVRT